MQTLLQDLRYTLRGMRRAPGFTLITVFTLALGIGSATAVFSVIDAVLLRPLPFAHQDRLVFPDTHAINGWSQPWSYPSYLDVRAQLTSFEALAGYDAFGKINLESPAGPVSLESVKGTDNFFQVFGVKPLLGRTYRAGEDQPGSPYVAVLSYEVWRSDFGGRKDAVGKVIRLDGVPYTVIGVMPSGFRYPLEALNAVYIPLHPDPGSLHQRGSHWLLTVGLLRPGVGREQAQANLRQVFANLGRAYPADADRTVNLLPLHTEVSGGVESPLEILSLAVLALLAIACVNVGGLLLARGIRREREMALRAAIGASRTRLLRQVMTEGLLLSVAALGGGVVIALLLLGAMRTFLVASMARGLDVRLNFAALAVGLALSGLTSVLASLVPALRLSGADPNSALRAGATAVGSGRGQGQLRSIFVITQVALSLVLLVISGLLLRQLQAVLSTKLGYPPDRVLTVHVDVSPGRYAGRDPLALVYEPLAERVSHLPGVSAAGLIDVLPVERWGHNQGVHITGQPPYARNDERWVENRFVTPGYFDAMGIHLLRGRMLSPGLDPWQNPAGTVVVNEAFRRMFFRSGGDPVGAHIDDNDKAELKTGIVGLVENTPQHLSAPPMPEMDLLAEEYPPADRLGAMPSMTLVVRSKTDPRPLIPAIRSALHELDPTIPFRAPETMRAVIARSLVFERLENWLFGGFALAALLLAVVGVYALTSHEVELRTRDIGVRMALGSTRARVGALILRRVGLLLCGGLAAGWALTLALRKLLAAVIQLHPGQDAAFLIGVTALIGV